MFCRSVSWRLIRSPKDQETPAGSASASIPSSMLSRADSQSSPS